MQCDFDTIGTTSPVADAETILVMFDLLREIGFKRFTIRINDRTVLNGLLQGVGLADKTTVILRAIDKLPKIGPQKVIEELQAAAGATSAQAQNIIQLVQLAGSNDDVLGELEKLGPGEQGVARLREVLSIVDAVPRPKENVLKLDPSIARGLDYYTGIVFETTLDDLPDIGSVCSGGRYDNLAELYTNQQLPGIGGSLGLDRLLAAMEELKMINAVRTPAEVFVPLFDETQTGAYFRLAAILRSAGIAVEVYPEPKKLGKQLQYADRRGYRVALVLGSDEFAAGQCQIKDLASGGSQTVKLDEHATALIAELRKLLAK
jgi:histidyl-tRNA synthetase